MKPDGQPGARGVDPSLAAIAAVITIDLLLNLGAFASAGLSHERIPPLNAAAPIEAFVHLGDPSRAWAVSVGGPFTYWACTAFIISFPVMVAILAYRRLAGRHRSEVAEGMASSREVAHAAGVRALRQRGPTLRPALPDPKDRDLGFLVGSSRGHDCWVSVEDSILLLGPPRSGKGHNLVIPAILDAPGAVVTTSTRPDNLTITFAARRHRGPVAVFDPQRIAHAPGMTPSLRWSPVRGCERPQTAMSRALALCADPAKSGVENGNFWHQQTVSVVRCLLHAAALGHRQGADLYRWSHAAAGAKEAVALLSHTPHSATGWDRALDSVIGADQRTRDSIWAMVANAFAPLADPLVLEAVTPSPGEDFDPQSFIQAGGTLYLIGTASGASATANLVAALIEDIVEAARRLAARSPRARLDPPLALLLDEAANYPLPSLPALMSEGGGSGITTLAVLQSLSQARDRWGREAAGAIWDSAIAKVVLGGSGNADDLAGISRLIGERDSLEKSETTGGGRFGKSVSVQVRRRPILEPSAVRLIPIGHGLLLLRSAPPIMMKLRPWTSRPEASSLTEERERFETALIAGADK